MRLDEVILCMSDNSLLFLNGNFQFIKKVTIGPSSEILQRCLWMENEVYGQIIITVNFLLHIIFRGIMNKNFIESTHMILKMNCKQSDASIILVPSIVCLALRFWLVKALLHWKAEPYFETLINKTFHLFGSLSLIIH